MTPWERRSRLESFGLELDFVKVDGNLITVHCTWYIYNYIINVGCMFIRFIHFSPCQTSALIRGILFHWQQEKLRALQRLQRLEQRFSGPGVTEAEARNALRLFERELSKAVG